MRSSKHCSSFCKISFHLNASYTKIHQHRTSIWIQHYICGLYIAMDYVVGVRIIKRFSKLADDLNANRNRQNSFAMHPLIKGLAIYEFHYDIMNALCFTYIIYIDNVWMRKRGS